MVYKIGLNNYNTTDKNSGLYEHKLLINKLDVFDNTVLFILNGKYSEGEKEIVLSMIKDKRLKGMKIVYIMTDSIAFDDTDVINECDLLLHQSIKYNFSNIHIKQAYSYIPEQFYTGNAERGFWPVKDRMVLFGGNDLRREDKIAEYLLNGDKQKPFTKSYIKSYSNNYDNRIEHSEFLEEMKKYKFQLMICREEYRNKNWLTARLFECLDCGCVPLFDIDYDKGYAYKEQQLEVQDYESMITKIFTMKDVRMKLEFLQNRAEYNKQKLVDNITDLL